jgi:hypothetical protein
MQSRRGDDGSHFERLAQTDALREVPQPVRALPENFVEP